MVVATDQENVTLQPDDDCTAEEFLSFHWKRRLYWLSSIPAQMHAVLACILDVDPRTLPCQFHGKASITSDGYVMCNFTDQHGRNHMGAFVTSFDTVENAFKSAARVAKLNDEDMRDLQLHLNGWIGTNYYRRSFIV